MQLSKGQTHKFSPDFPVTELCLLAPNGVPLRCKVDTEDLPKIFAVSTRWRAVYDKKLGSYYVKARSTSLHRLVTDAPKGMKVDHLHHDTLDNRKSELRVVTHAENCRNSRRKLAKSGARGVYPSASSNKANPWKAQVALNGKDVFLGNFPTVPLASEAVQAFCEANGLIQTLKTKAVGAL